MRNYFRNRSEAIETYKDRIEKMLNYIKEQGNMSIEQLDKEEKIIEAKILNVDKNLRSYSMFFWQVAELKSREYRAIQSNILTAIEICSLYNVKNTEDLPDDIMSEKELSKIIDLACEAEKKNNLEVEKTKNGCKTYVFSKINKNNDELSL